MQSPVSSQLVDLETSAARRPPSFDRESDAVGRLTRRWIRVQLARGQFDEWVLSNVTAALLAVPEFRGYVRLAGEPEREPNSWREVDAYEVLFSNVAHQGCMPEGCEVPEFLALIKAFAGFLGAQGVIPKVEHTHLQAEFDLWAERLEEVLETGGWYEPCGTYRPPLQSEPEREREPEPEPGGPYSGKVPVSEQKRRAKKAQRKARRKSRRPR